MKKCLLFTMIVMLCCASLVSAQTALNTWSINDDWARNDPDGFGPENTWQVHGDDTAAIAAPFIDTSAQYLPVYIAGYASGNRAMFKAYTDPNATTEAEKPAGSPADPGSGILDLGDVGSISPNQLCFTTWQVPRDMIIRSTLTMYSVGSSSSTVAFLVRNNFNGPPINPEDCCGHERSFSIPAYAGTREYVTAEIAPFTVTAGQHIMYWHRSNVGDNTGMIGISEWKVEELDPNTMPDPWSDCRDPDDPNGYDPNSGPDYIWEMPRDYSPNDFEGPRQNPYRDWSYGESNGLGNFNLFTQNQTLTVPPETFYHVRWSNLTWAVFPNVHRVFSMPAWTGAEDCCVAGHTAPAGQAYQNWVVRWTSPIDAFVGVIGRFGQGASGSIDCWIYKIHPGQDPAAGEVLYEALGAEVGNVDSNFGLVTDVEAGTTIDFVVGPGPDFGGEDTPLYVQIGESLSPQCEDIGIYLPMDFNKDCYVDLQDFATFAASWLDCNHPADLSCE